MKIGNTSDMAAVMRASTSPAASVAQKTAQGTPTPVAKNGSSSSAGGVSISVSNRARSVNAGLDATPDIDMDKVNAVRSAIEQGTYKVDAGAIADKLLGSAREFLSKPARA
jgi:negative regulator of flagellin synthesis FlgM